mgnify:CR=1 FL=1
MSLHIRPHDIINIAEALKHPQNQKRATNETYVHIKSEKTEMTIKTLKKILRHQTVEKVSKNPLTS